MLRQGLFIFTSPASEKAGKHKELGGAQPDQLTPAGDILYHMASSSVHKL